MILNFTKIDALLDRVSRSLERRTFRLYPTAAGSFLFAALGALILLLIPSQIKTRPDQAITAATFPGILALLILGGSLLNLIRDGLRLLRREKIPFLELNLLTEVKALILLLFLVLYAVMMPLTGFIAASAIYGILMLLFFRVRTWRSYLLIIVLAGAIGSLFKYVLHVRLP